MARAALAIVAVWLAALAVAATAQPAPEAAQPAPEVAASATPALPSAEATAIARRAEAALRGETTIRSARITLSSPKRVVALHTWDDRRRDRSFLRILSPAKDAGTGYLRLPPNVWRYVPRPRGFTRIAPGKTLEPWLGGGLTLDDWLHESNELDDYEHVLLRSEQDADGREGVAARVLAYRPRAGVGVVWGRIEAWIATDGDVPLRKDFYDAKGARVRTLRFHDVRAVDGRLVPHRWVLTSETEPDRETRIDIESVAFDREIDDTVFSTRNLANPEAK